METLKDLIYNTYLQLKNSINRRLNKQCNQFNSKGYGKPVKDIFVSFSRWQLDYPWGIYSKTERLSYVNDIMVLPPIVTGTYLSLRTRKLPKVNHYNGFEMPWAIGNIMAKYSFRQYGAFEVVAKVHPAKGVWHAPLWFVAANAPGSHDPYAVLPEPDVAEVYSNGNANKMMIKSNLHYGTDYEDNAESIGARTHYIPNFTGRWVSYGMIWKEDRIEIYYDWHLCRVITDPKVLERLKHGLYPIIGVGVKPGEDHEGSEMEVASFNYWKEI